jgi:hypothetical protein
MSPSVSVPKDLAKWIDERARLLASLGEQLEAIAKHDRRDRQAWTLNLLEEAAELETHARRMVHLLTAYALRERLASATVVAKRSGVTITGAQNRNGSALAQEVWSEVFGSSGSTP